MAQMCENNRIHPKPVTLNQLLECSIPCSSVCLSSYRNKRKILIFTFHQIHFPGTVARILEDSLNQKFISFQILCLRFLFRDHRYNENLQIMILKYYIATKIISTITQIWCWLHYWKSHELNAFFLCRYDLIHVRHNYTCGIIIYYHKKDEFQQISAIRNVKLKCAR